jgi:hypothetical protein
MSWGGQPPPHACLRGYRVHRATESDRTGDGAHTIHLAPAFTRR